MTSIGDGAFYGCTGITSIAIPDNVKTIGTSAFYGCSGLTSLIIPNLVTIIESSTFSGCIGLTSITLPDNVKTIGSSAFSGCIGLEEFIISKDNQAYRTLDGVLFSKDKINLVCYPNAKGSTYSISEGVTSIGSYAFYGCIDLTSITLSNSLTSIGNLAFSGCTGLTSITFPNSVKSIGSLAFSGCEGLNSIYCMSSMPPAVGENGFKDVNESTCKLYVPKESYGAYWSAKPWYDFENIIGIDPESGVKNTTLEGIKLYPNSAASLLYIGLGENTEICDISIYSTTGQKVHTEVATATNISLDISRYPAGTYIVQASDINKQIYNLGKFVKK